MSLFTSHLVEPLYRLFFGRPPDSGGDATRARGLVLIADGVGGLDMLRDRPAIRRGCRAAALIRSGWSPGATGSGDGSPTSPTRRTAIARPGWSPRPCDASGPPSRMIRSSWSGSRAGLGVMVKALEELDEESVERVVLLAPALSPGYDLTPSLRAVRGDVVVFWSPYDVIILGAGTRLFGTIDRRPERRRRAGRLRRRPGRTTRTRRRSVSMRSSARSDGSPGWRRRAISAATSGRIVRYFCASTSCRSCGSVTPIRSRPEPPRIRFVVESREGSSRPAGPPISLWPGRRGSRDSRTAGPQASESDTSERGRPGSFSCRRSRLEQSVRDAARRGPRAPSSGFVLGALVIEGSLEVEFREGVQPSALENWHLDAAPRGGLRLPQGRPFPPCPTQRSGGTASHLIPFDRPGSRRSASEFPGARRDLGTQVPCEIAAWSRHYWPTFCPDGVHSWHGSLDHPAAAPDKSPGSRPDGTLHTTRRASEANAIGLTAWVVGDDAVTAEQSIGNRSR